MRRRVGESLIERCARARVVGCARVRCDATRRVRRWASAARLSPLAPCRQRAGQPCLWQSRATEVDCSFAQRCRWTTAESRNAWRVPRLKRPTLRLTRRGSCEPAIENDHDGRRKMLRSWSRNRLRTDVSKPRQIMGNYRNAHGQDCRHCACFPPPQPLGSAP